jgi:hypothetical protein
MINTPTGFGKDNMFLFLFYSVVYFSNFCFVTFIYETPLLMVINQHWNYRVCLRLSPIERVEFYKQYTVFNMIVLLIKKKGGGVAHTLIDVLKSSYECITGLITYVIDQQPTKKWKARDFIKGGPERRKGKGYLD